MRNSSIRCRFCGSTTGEVVLDLGRQPSWGHMPLAAEPLPDPLYPLRMWWCRDCCLAQLAEDAEVVEEVFGVEPRVSIEQSDLSVARMGEQGLLRAGARVLEFGSPHGTSWLPRLAERGLVPLTESDHDADVIADFYGLLHESDQDAALRARAEALAPGGTLVLQLHSFATILRRSQWYDLRHGHFAYWSMPALDRALRLHGLGVHRAWWYPMAGGTVLVMATADPDPDSATRELIDAELRDGVCRVEQIRRLQDDAAFGADLRAWLDAQRAAGRLVLGYGAAARSVPLIAHAAIDADLLPAVADASPAKQGKRMPGTTIPIISPDELVDRAPDRVVLFLSGLAEEVRGALPGVESGGGRWVVLDPGPRLLEFAPAG